MPKADPPSSDVRGFPLQGRDATTVVQPVTKQIIKQRPQPLEVSGARGSLP